MIIPAQGLRIVLAVRPVDFRCGHDALAGLVQNTLGLDPHSGLIVVFRSKRADRLKILLWDGTGLVLVYKRLGRDGRFEWPQISDGVMHLTRVQFEALFEGLNWKLLSASSRASTASFRSTDTRAIIGSHGPSAKAACRCGCPHVGPTQGARSSQRLRKPAHPSPKPFSRASPHSMRSRRRSVAPTPRLGKRPVTSDHGRSSLNSRGFCASKPLACRRAARWARRSPIS